MQFYNIQLDLLSFINLQEKLTASVETGSMDGSFISFLIRIGRC